MGLGLGYELDCGLSMVAMVSSGNFTQHLHTAPPCQSIIHLSYCNLLVCCLIRLDQRRLGKIIQFNSIRVESCHGVGGGFA